MNREDINVKKDIIRKAVLAIRDGMSIEEVENKSRAVIEKIYRTDAYKESKVIMCYVNFRNEVVTRGFMERCLNEHKRVAVPLVRKFSLSHEEGLSKTSHKTLNKRTSEIIASEIYNLENDLGKGSFGILEPLPENVREVDPRDIDVVIVPGVAFDLKRNRLGFGAGYYDRFLSKVRSDCAKIGICYESQLTDDIPVNQHDIKMDMIITEKRIIK